MTELAIEHVIVAWAATLIIALVKGAFGGGFGLVGIPLLSLVMDPITAGAVVAPLFIPMDIVSLKYFPPRTWSIPDIKVLIPGLVVGIGLGTLAIAALDTRWVAIATALVALAFAAQWYVGGQKVGQAPRNAWHAALASTISGVTTMVAHSGGPPLAVYLLRLGLAREVFVGTTTIYFTVGNLIKVGPWLVLGQPTVAMWQLIGLCVPVAVIGVWIGWLLNKRLDQRQFYTWCYLILTVSSLKLLWDGVRGFM